MTHQLSGEVFRGPAEDACLMSIVIVAWNTRALLRDCLASTVTATRELSGKVEIIVVDNASSDGSAEMVTDQFPAVRVIRNESNVGFAAANNQALRDSRGRYLLLLNPDTSRRRGCAARAGLVPRDASRGGRDRTPTRRRTRRAAGLLLSAADAGQGSVAVVSPGLGARARVLPAEPVGIRPASARREHSGCLHARSGARRSSRRGC